MTRDTLYVDPPQISAAFLFDQLDEPQALGRLCDVASASGAAATGECEIVRGDGFPVFDAISDLAPTLERARYDLRAAAGRAEWQRLVEGGLPEAHLLRAGFEVPRVGTAVVELQPGAARVRGPGQHPAAVTVSGDLLGMPPSVSLSKAERRQAEVTAVWIAALFRRANEALDPLYGGVLIEAYLPPPATLAAGEGRIGPEVYVSDRLEAGAPGTQSALAALYAQGSVSRLATGQLYSGWGALNPDGRSVPQPLAVASKAAAILGGALAALG